MYPLTFILPFTSTQAHTQASKYDILSLRHINTITSSIILVVVDDIRYTLKHVVLSNVKQFLLIPSDMVVSHLHSTDLGKEQEEEKKKPSKSSTN